MSDRIKDNSRLAVVREYGSVMDAEIDRDYLYAYSIEAELFDDNTATVYPGFPGTFPVRLVVREELLEKANEVLNSK